MEDENQLMWEKIQTLEAALEASLAREGALRAQITGHRVNYRRVAQQLATLTGALLAASEAAEQD